MSYWWVLITIFGHANSFPFGWFNTTSSTENTKNNSIEDHESTTSWFLIYPGTKWCGVGNDAENYEDLGKFNETDSCCRGHDQCADYIEGHQQKYNLTNPVFYTRLHCKCDDDFRKCLENATCPISSQVGHIYFTLLGTQCFEKEYPITNCTKNTYLPCKKCIEYEYDPTKPKLFQWFDLPNY